MKERRKRLGAGDAAQLAERLSPLQETLALSLSTNQVWWWTPCDPALRGCRQDDRFRITFSHIASPRPIWDM